MVQVTRLSLLSKRENSQTIDFFVNLNIYKTPYISKLSYKIKIHLGCNTISIKTDYKGKHHLCDYRLYL